MRKIKMIGFDLDDTLLTTNKILTERTKRALIKAAEQGIIVLPATGRSLSGLPKELLDLPVIRYAVTVNGAKVLEVNTGNVLYEKLISREKACQILDIFGEYDTLQDVCYNGVGYTDERILALVYGYVANRAMGDYISSTKRTVPDIRKKLEEEDRGPEKIQALFKSREDRKQAWKRIEELGGVEVTGAIENNIEVNAEGVNKGSAMLGLGEVLGIRQDEIMAFGDGANDRKMLEAVGVGVAMDNAIPEVKAAADYITGSNDEDGVAEFIEKYVLD